MCVCGGGRVLSCADPEGGEVENHKLYGFL